MMLDSKLTKIGLKMKKLIVLDVSFLGEDLKEFKSAYPKRYVHLPSHQDMILEMAAGMASLEKLVLVVGSELVDCDLADTTLKVKVLRRSDDAVWDYFEEGLRTFGTGVLLIPEKE
jgi:transketolase C-terminal domain/subunit